MLARMETPALAMRRAAPSDLARVDALFARSFPALLKADYPPSVMVLAVPRLARANPALLASGRYFVTETADGRIVGAGGWSVGGGGAAEVRQLAVDPGFTRCGIARRLLDSVLGEVQSAGFARLGCLATRTGVAFYHTVGFRSLGPMTVTLAPGIGFEVIRMVRPMG